MIPHLTTKICSYLMWEALTNLYKRSNENTKMVLSEKLKSIRMTKDESVTSYLTKINQVRNELGMFGEKVDGSELVRITLNGMKNPWTVFVEAIVSRENTPS